jgi:hypothetical protein
MTLPSSGTLGLGNDGNSNTIGYELRQYYSTYSQIGLADNRPEGMVGQSQNQAINMGQFYGKSAGFNLYYSYAYYSGERGQYGEVDSSTNVNPPMTINGYSVQFIASTTYNTAYTFSSLYINGLVGRYFFNNLYGYDGYAYNGSNASYYGQYGGSTTYFQWYGVFGNRNGGLLYAPAYGNGSGYQVFTYN